MRISSWMAPAPGEPMALQTRDEEPGPADVIVEVAACGVCHTDLSFYYEGVPTRRPFPITLGHEVSGRVIATGSEARAGSGRRAQRTGVRPAYPTWVIRRRPSSSGSNLMAFDAVAQGNWGCLPEHYPAVLALTLDGRVAIEPFHRAQTNVDDKRGFCRAHARKRAEANRADSRRLI